MAVEITAQAVTAINVLGMLVSEEATDSFQLTWKDGRAASVTVDEDSITEVSFHH